MNLMQIIKRNKTQFKQNKKNKQKFYKLKIHIQKHTQQQFNTNTHTYTARFADQTYSNYTTHE